MFWFLLYSIIYHSNYHHSIICYSLLSFKTRLFSLALIYGGPESARAICISKLVLKIWKKWHTGHGVSIWSHVELGWLPFRKNLNYDSLIQDFLVKLKHHRTGWIVCDGLVHGGGILVYAIAPPLVQWPLGWHLPIWFLDVDWWLFNYDLLSLTQGE